jgi:hypothetical protein
MSIVEIEAEEAWKLRVLHMLQRDGPQKTSSIGQFEPRPGKKKTVTQLLKSDERFTTTTTNTDKLSDGEKRWWCSAQLLLLTKTTTSKSNNNCRKRQKKTSAAVVVVAAPQLPFSPAKTHATPSYLCWEILLTNPCTAAALSSWRWIWVLTQVNHTFKASIQADSWVKWMCVSDKKPSIWKSKANDLLALTAKDLQDVECSVVCGTGRSRYKETHLMHRQTLLQLALSKYGGTISKINAVFLKKNAAAAVRKEKKEKNRCNNNRHRHNNNNDNYYDDDDDDYDDDSSIGSSGDHYRYNNGSAATGERPLPQWRQLIRL